MKAPAGKGYSSDRSANRLDCSWSLFSQVRFKNSRALYVESIALCNSKLHLKGFERQALLSSLIADVAAFGHCLNAQHTSPTAARGCLEKAGLVHAQSGSHQLWPWS